MQANYPDKLPLTSWDTVNINYPIKKFPETGVSSETIAREWRSPPDVLKALKTPVEEEKQYNRDYTVTLDFLRTQTKLDYGYKTPEAYRFNKHTSCSDNVFIYPPSKKLEDRTPSEKVHGTSEMKSLYKAPVRASRLITDKDQFKHPASLHLEPKVEPFQKEIEQWDTTYEGFEKYLDPYLTTNRLNHRPFTADQLSRSSNTRDILTYYTYSNTPWVRCSKPNTAQWRLPLSKPKSVYDREKFKEAFREIRTHNKLNWVPRTFHTETMDNFTQPSSRSKSQICDEEKEVRSHFQRCIANLKTNAQQEQFSIKHFYTTENSHVGSGKPICSIIDQHFEKNKKLEQREKK
ncbi:unnamed protein product [Euphydryas editha]|uniref:Uncharacterized protein n=1 Tax=Euphydryas editha TaxID=104508 RepID=A0AAU9TRJ1_EUPED|nr:unnamed protein product [Euphydryas editha]